MQSLSGIGVVLVHRLFVRKFIATVSYDDMLWDVADVVILIAAHTELSDGIGPASARGDGHE